MKDYIVNYRPIGALFSKSFKSSNKKVAEQYAIKRLLMGNEVQIIYPS